MLPEAKGLIGSLVTSVDAATAATADGASFLVLTPNVLTIDGVPSSLQPEILASVSKSQRSGLSVPLIVSTDAMAPADVTAWLQGSPQGLYGTVDTLASLCNGAPEHARVSGEPPLTTLFAGLQTKGWPVEASTSGEDIASGHSGLLSGLLEGSRLGSLLEREKALLREILSFLGEAVPEMEEAKLLSDALIGARSLHACEDAAVPISPFQHSCPYASAASCRNVSRLDQGQVKKRAVLAKDVKCRDIHATKRQLLFTGVLALHLACNMNFFLSVETGGTTYRLEVEAKAQCP
jgi:hypothetical protein